MRVQTFSLGELQANCYLLEEEGKCILIDPADDANFLLEEMSRQNLELVALLATHGHFDHVMAAGEIQLSYRVPLYIGEKDVFLINRLKETAKHFLGYEPFITKPSIIEPILSDELLLNGWKIRVIRTPGHTPGSISYYLPDQEIVFTGDTLFQGAVGRTDLSYSSKPDLRQSLIKLYELPEQAVVYPGHGEETTILAEKP